MIFLLIPIHWNIRKHWCCSVIDINKKTIKYYDPLMVRSPGVFKKIRDCFTYEANELKTSFLEDDWKDVVVTSQDAPQQLDSSSCGVYSLLYMRNEALGSSVIKSISEKNIIEIRSWFAYRLLQHAEIESPAKKRHVQRKSDSLQLSSTKEIVDLTDTANVQQCKTIRKQSMSFTIQEFQQLLPKFKDTICDIYLGKVFSERHYLFIKGKQSRERTKMMWLPERWSECDDNVSGVCFEIYKLLDSVMGQEEASLTRMSYVMSVSFPEAANHAIMRKYEIDYTTANEFLYK
ncbi:uncharacterized protein LOC134192228 [Corticium candelabrum]|uniref:uncharacterized protein LOC134192228 n=1 Tax=Corticium candelabrum TaxID=121492 RepID=UPI002E27111A|nr:uncharacterized protein LOC134192228 [Corticium candelabrum]